eukprot:jgi/Ulvmu1/4675/UM002_0406.1
MQDSSFSREAERNSEGRSKADQVLTECIAAAVLQADLRPEQIKCVACGLSGIDTLDDARGRMHLLRGFLKQLEVPNDVPCWVFNDAIAALASATQGPPYGISVIAGTGSICIGLSGNSFHRASGWGSTIGDGGGGFDIGRRALAAVAASVDERQPPTALAGALACTCGAASMAELLRWVHRDTSWASVASLAPTVLACASSGDAAATAILQQAAAELVDSVYAVARKIQQDSGSGPPPLVLSGGLLAHHEHSTYLRLVEQELRAKLPQHKILRPIVDSATGAALLGAFYLRNGTSDREGAYCHGVIDELSRNCLVENVSIRTDGLAIVRKETVA